MFTEADYKIKVNRERDHGIFIFKKEVEGEMNKNFCSQLSLKKNQVPGNQPNK